MRAGAFGLVLGFCAIAGAAPGPAPIILISVDTLRADVLSCYSPQGRSTPHLDAIAKGGTLFSQTSASIPLTLPSHLSLLSSTYPFSNGVEDNGQLVPSGVITLATILKAHGYKTAAFIGGFSLDRRFGLDRGFDVYDSSFPLSSQDDSDAASLKRLGEDVTRSATGWIEKNAGGPFFVFLHLYDLHTPENLPKAVRARFPGPRYSAELGYVDEVVGNFWSYLGKRGLLAKALVVFLSDHGEGLSEHGESTHGYFVYQSTISVPLIFHWPAGSRQAPARVDEPVSLLGVAPSILQFLHIAVPPSFQGKPLPGLGPRNTNPDNQLVYSESVYSHNHFGTSGLFSVRNGKYKYIQAPTPELFDLAADPNEQHNVYATQTQVAADCRKRLADLRTRFRPAPAKVVSAATPAVAARLRSLGYAAGRQANPAPLESGPDPKDFIGDYTRYRQALSLATAGKLRASNTLLEGILSDRPTLIEVRNMLALNQQRLGEHDMAVKNFREVLVAEPQNAAAHLSLASSYSRLDHLSEALQEAQVALEIASAQKPALEHVAIPAREMIGAIYVRNSDYNKARAEYLSLLTLDAGNYEAHYNLAWLDTHDGHNGEAVAHLQAALKSNPGSATAHNALGSIYLQRKDLEHASKEFAEAVRLDPKFVYAHYNLGMVLELQGAKDAAAEQFRETLSLAPRFQPARDALTRMGLN
jgi:tetratricopeptide (TPR) repeat protein